MVEVIKRLLLDIVNKIDAGNSNITEEEAISIVKTLKTYTDQERRLSKYSACQYLNISRATFDNYVKDGLLPRGKKELGFKELSWSLKDLNKLIKRKERHDYKEKNNNSNI